MRLRARIVTAAVLAAAPLLAVNQTHGLTGLGTEGAITRDVLSRVVGETCVAPADHPRLFVRSADLPALRARATDANPVFRGLKGLAEEARQAMDEGKIPDQDGGGAGWTLYPTERYSALFAFMSLIGPEAERDDYADRAHELLMHVMNEAAKGPMAGKPFRDPGFATRDRSRWTGEAFGLTVDWIYDELSQEDLATIRQVFLRWIEENKTATTTGHNHPVPINVVNDPVLLQGADGKIDREKVRWSANNYYTAHMRNIGLMGLSFDAADDPGGLMRDAVENATGAWLYVTDHLLRGDMAGGLAPEGFEYGPQTVSYLAQFMAALETAGQADPEAWGPQVVMDGNPFWDEVLPAHLASLSPAKKLIPGNEWFGPAFQPSWFGSAQQDWFPDMIGWAAPLAIHAMNTGDQTQAARLRWLTMHAPVGGAAELETRVRRPPSESAFESMLYFLMLNPNDPQGYPVTDPRPTQPLSYTGTGLGRSLVRTDNTEDASLFGYTLGWNTINHQSANGNHIELYRNGEWLLKQRTGYDLPFLASDNHNTLAIENVDPKHSGDWREMLARRGSQWLEGLANADGRILAQSAGDDYFYALGDSTGLHNSSYEESEDVAHASRSVVWIKPDVVVTYDRAESTSEHMFKRFWLNLPDVPQISEQTATIITSKNRLDVTTLLPTDATPQGLEAKNEPQAQPPDPANGNEMVGKLLVEAPGDPRSARFLHVIDAGDPTSTREAAQLVSSTSGSDYSGAQVGDAVVLFPADVPTVAPVVVGTAYDVPTSVTRHYVTGLEPGAVYDVDIQEGLGSRKVTVQKTTQSGSSSGVEVVADSGGLLRFSDESGRTVAVHSHGAADTAPQQPQAAAPKCPPPPTTTPTATPTPVPPAAPDLTAPKTKVKVKPTPLKRVMKVVATANEAGSKFQCKLDRQKRYKSCKATHRLRVSVGRHVLRVRAIDRAGNIDRSPAKASWVTR